MPHTDKHGELVLVSGLPQEGALSSSRKWKKRLRAIFLDTLGVALGRIKLGVNSDNHLKGFCFLGLDGTAGNAGGGGQAGPSAALEALVGTVIRIDAIEDYDSAPPLPASVSAAPAAPAAPVAPLSRTPLTLHISRQTDRRDLLFPHLDEAQRRALQFDTVAFFSCCDAHSADRLSRILVAMATIGRRASQTPDGSTLHILDAFGCVGGNAASFAKYFDAVTTVELEPKRYAMLTNNIAVALPPHLSNRVKCVCGDAFVQAQHPAANVVYFDPPWGGTNYNSSTDKIVDLEFPCGPLETAQAEATVSSAATPPPSVATSPVTHTHNLRAMICLAGNSHKDLVTLRLPTNFDIDALARWSVSPSRKEDGLIGDAGGKNNDRPLPFQVRIGHKAILFALALPLSRPSAGPKRLSFGLHNLDEIIHSLHALDRRFLREFHPKFFDWEADRWIRLKHWKGVKN